MRGKCGTGLVFIAAGLISLPAQGQEITDWSGFYAGIFGGYALDREASSGSTIGPAVLDLGGDILSGNLVTGNGRINGVFGGAAAGYTYQHDQLVMGLELGAGLGDFGKANSTIAALSIDDGANIATIDYSDVTQFNVNWYSTLQGRLGYAQDNWMVYLKGGAAIADASATNTSRIVLSDPGGILGLPDLDLPSSGSSSQVLVGPAFGFGIEAMMTDTVSVSAEYSYIGLPSMTAPGSLLGGLLGGGGSAFKAEMHQIKAGVNYHF